MLSNSAFRVMRGLKKSGLPDTSYRRSFDRDPACTEQSDRTIIILEYRDPGRRIINIKTSELTVAGRPIINITDAACHRVNESAGGGIIRIIIKAYKTGSWNAPTHN